MKIFLSSTYDDLIEYRRATMEVLQECEILYKGMEFFGATENKPHETCLKNLNDADRVIVLIGSRYGSRPKTQGPSYTEIEILEARRLKKPIQAYFLDLEKTAILAKHFESGHNAKDLKKLKKLLTENYTVDKFSSPADLGRILARDFFRESKHNIQKQKLQPVVSRFRETAYDSLAEWYDDWYQGHWSNEEPFNKILNIINSYNVSSKGSINDLKILDCACGTGNSFVAFTKHNFEVYGTDGSYEMLQKAKENCNSAKISTERLILDPINWTDGKAYEDKFGTEKFDVIINTANSFCHIPPISGYMDVALTNFYNLLKPGGLLIIDTKKYIRNDSSRGLEKYQELRYDATSQDWIVRTERHDTCQVDGYGEVHFNTRLVYDSDPSFNTDINRALIVITINGPTLIPRVLVVPYYPLPASKLEQEMRKANYTTSYIPVPKIPDWKYDFVVGQKQ